MPADASQAFARALEHQRLGSAGWQSEARKELQQSLAFAEDWLAPKRLLDDLERDDLRGHAALAEHLESLAQVPEPEGAAYLAGRLEGRAGGSRFQGQAHGGSQNAWFLHGRAWLAGQRGQHGHAVELERKALRLARDPWEETYFALSGARHSLNRERPDEALAWIDQLLGQELSSSNRLRLELFLAPLEMRLQDEHRRMTGYWRALSLLFREPLTGTELNSLLSPVFGLIALRAGSSNMEELLSALAAFDTPARRRMRARLLFDRGARSMALGLIGPLESGETDALSDERISRGGIVQLIENWYDGLPSQVLAEDGLPRSPALRRMLAAARAGDDMQSRFLLGEALLEAGWYREAQGLSNPLAELDLERALKLEQRATAGRSILLGIERIFDVLDRGQPYSGPRLGQDPFAAPRTSIDPKPIRSLEELLLSLQPLFDRHQWTGAHDFAASPRLSIGPFATILHPGPYYSARDEQRGLGPAGAAVPGLAASLASMGRFGVFGEVLGGAAPDGAILRVLASEEISGAHLGVAFRGNRIWCDGADLGSQPARRGASIAGAAVHEGYWIDVQVVRQALWRWHSLEARFFGGREQKATRALAAQGPRLPGILATQKSEGPQLIRMRNSADRQVAYAALGESDRIRLAVLRDRREAKRRANEALGSSMTLEELLEVTARHEEGHLTDQTRFLPLGEHLFAALGFLVQVGFSADALSEELEYRAQLICLSVAEDPRLPLAECVLALENGGGLTPHAGAYQRLVSDLLATLEASKELRVGLDPTRYWIHQLHHLSSEQVRALALKLAEQKGLSRD